MSTNAVELASSLKCISRLLLTLRDKSTNKVDFVRHADRLMTVICEEGLSHVEAALKKTSVETPTGATVEGELFDTSGLVVVSIIRAGDSMLDAFLKIVPDASVGKILIQRDEETTLPIMYYSKLPELKDRQIVLLDPMLATAGSANVAIKTLIEKGADEEKIVFFNVISCPQGIANMGAAFPKIRIITGKIDETLNEKAYIMPGLGDYGDRYFGTA